MNRQELETLAHQLREGHVSVAAFIEQWEKTNSTRHAGIDDVGAAQVDTDRQRRCGFPEVVFAEGKTIDAIREIFRSLVKHGTDVLATRMGADKADALLKDFPNGRYNAAGRTFRIPLPEQATQKEPQGKIVIITAGTSDLPVAEEARETALWTGADVVLLQDIGVAGPHRLRANLPKIQGADAVVVIAGMEGALPSVVGGYVDCPVIAVPTSVGYGAAFSGLAALLGMLNSCASNVTVVNIDAGFKGGYVAGLIAKNAAKARQGS